MGGGGTDFSAGVGGLSGGPSTSSLLSAPIGGGGYLSQSTSPGLLGSITGALPQIAKTFQGGLGGMGGAGGGAGNPASINSRAGGVSNSVGQGEPMANLFGQMNSPNGLDHLWQQAFGPSPMPNVLNATLGKTMGGY